MKILLINNYQQNNETATYEALKAALIGHQVSIQRYKPGLQFADKGQDLVILSGGGGEGSEINDQYSHHKLWYEDQMEYILSSNKPILGICMGFEVIARAYGAKVIEMKDYITGFRRIVSTNTGQKSFNKKLLTQYENHRWHVPTVSAEQFKVLATSQTGVEIIKHKKRKIIAAQFHPEKGGTLKLDQLISHTII